MNAFELDHVTKRYGDYVLDGLTLSLGEGGIMGLIGENGAGKTTAIRLIMGAARPDSGAVRLLGRADPARDHRVKQDVGVVLDEALFPECLTAQDVSKIMARTYTRWDPAAYEGYIARFALPPQKQIRDYSRGMKMKLSLAVALSHAARLLVMDEPTSGLDPVIRDEILTMLCDFTRDAGHSVLISSHILSDLEKICDYIALLHRGRLLLCGEKDQLLERYGLFNGPEAQLKALPAAAVRAAVNTPYGARALVDRALLRGAGPVEPCTLEDIMLYMTREAQA